MRGAKAAAELLRERLDTPVLCQGEDSTANLVGRFAEDEETTSSAPCPCGRAWTSRGPRSRWW